MVDNYNDHCTAISAVAASSPDLVNELRQHLDYQVAIDSQNPHQNWNELPPWATEILGLEIFDEEDGAQDDTRPSVYSHSDMDINDSSAHISEGVPDLTPHTPALPEVSRDTEIQCAEGLHAVPCDPLYDGERLPHNDSGEQTSFVLPIIAYVNILFCVTFSNLLSSGTSNPTRRIIRHWQVALLNSTSINSSQKRKYKALEDVESGDDQSDNDLPEYDSVIEEDQSERLIEALATEYT
ncbi:hypothetical protein FISHEDRAFT_74066 [Fistulina hepatica ATCC 64428]|uniref:Uncharacterized protein n=1 Tax=Fistulina hepatica ATCC 64428 TaxID=1128425 RepID=A0A0D7ADR8_9AGAR|nr:hypothetical protein FISHEDRAFT_74066 [Fistulina hepatica ATCC 64428]